MFFYVYFNDDLESCLNNRNLFNHLYIAIFRYMKDEFTDVLL